jgi:hypothetical protein
MDKIYAGAEEVLVWLGPTADGSDTVLEGLPKLRTQINALRDSSWTPRGAPQDEVEMVNSELGQLIGKLLARPWFRRLWVMQEAVLARSW